MILLKYLSKLLKALKSGESPAQLAGGFVLGMIMGLTPFWNLHNLVVFILILIIRVNISMAILGFALFSGFAYLLDPLFHNLGFWALVDVNAFKNFWTSIYNTPIGSLSNFNNTVVLGSLIISLVLVLPMFFLTKVGVVQYREKIDTKVQKLKIVQVFKSSKLYSIYEKINDWRD